MLKILPVVFLLFISGFAQTEEDSIEVFLIDNFVTPEEPHVLKLSFFTSAPAKSKLILDRTHELTISNEFIDNHKFELTLSEMEFRNDTIPFVIIVEDSAGNEYSSDVYDFNIPYEPQVEGESNFLLLCLFSGVIFGLPSPGIAFTDDEMWFVINKEIPLISIRGGLNYPLGYFAMEYSHIFNAPKKNFIRVGYKHIIETPFLRYLSPGINFVTDFSGFNGISPEASIGWAKLFNTFTIYTRYRFNFKPGETGSEFHEFSLGIYSSFFSLHL